MTCDAFIPARILQRGTHEGADCANCPLAVNGGPRRPIVAEGPEHPKWIALTGAPGRMELAYGRPLAGRGGALLADAIQGSGDAREDVWVTSTVLCGVGPEVTDAGRRSAARACASRLLKELAKFPGKPVLALGAEAARAVLGARIQVSALLGTYHAVTLATPAARAIQGELDALFELRARARGVLARAETALAQAEAQHASCTIDPIDPKHARACKALRRVNKTRAKRDAANSALKDVQQRIDDKARLLDEEVARSGDLPRRVIPTVNPEAVVMGGSGAAGAHSSDLAAWNLRYDAAKVAAFAAGRDGIVFEDDYVTEWRDSDRAQEIVEAFLTTARRAGWMAVDCESFVEDPRHSALQPHHAKLRALGLATEDSGVSVYWPIVNERTRDLVRRAMADVDIRKVFHNGLYDVPLLRANGYPVDGEIDDTMLLHHVAFPGMSHRLQAVGAQFMAVAPWKSEFRDGEEDPATLTAYNAKDTLVTARVSAPLQVIVRRTKAERAYELDRQMARIATRMHEVGVPIHEGVNKALIRTFSATIQRARGSIEARAHDPDVLPRLWARLAFEQAQRRRKGDPEDFAERVDVRVSELQDAYARGKWRWSISTSDHVVAYLKARGVPMMFKTKSGRTSTQKLVLENLQHVSEVADIINFRENDKLLSTFVRPMYMGSKRRAPFVGADGRIHPIWSVHAITSRWRSTMPGVQNWPKANKKRKRVDLRSQVVAPRGRMFVGFDFAQLEARGIALLSGDPFLVRLFAEGRDIHKEFARIVWEDFDLQDPKTQKLLRDMIKRPEYGWLFGGTVQTLWQNVVRDYPKVQLADIARMVQKMERAMGGVTRWHNDLVRMAASPPYELRSAIYDRRRCFPLGTADTTDLYNWPVQTLGAEVMNTGLLHFVQWLSGAHPTADVILHIHDAAVIECDEDDADSVAAGAVRCFTQERTHNGNTVQFPIDCKIARTWAKL